MKTFFIISLIIVIVSLFTIILHKKITSKHFLSTWLDGFSLFLCLVFAIIGLIGIPLIANYKTNYIELTNYTLIKSPHLIILDLTNSPQKYGYGKLVKFDSHEIVETYNDSTKFFIEDIRSFYNVSVNKEIVWSKPPYKYYNYE